MAEGWVCPKCQSVYSPFMYECLKCNSDRKGEDIPAKDFIRTLRDPFGLRGTHDSAKLS